MPSVLVVTTEGVPGYRITSVIGQVVGSIARLSNAFTEGIRTMDGQLNPHRGHDLAQWRTDAVNAMVEEARKKGANAVIGTRFDNRLISTAWAEICAYGTAVRVDPQDGHPVEGAAPAQPPRASSPVVPAAKDPSGSSTPDGGSSREYGVPREGPPQDEVVWRRPKGAGALDSPEPEAGSRSAGPRSPEPEPEPAAKPGREAEPAAKPAPEAKPGPAAKAEPKADAPEIRGADDPAAVAAEPSATGWPEETGPEPDERVGPERLRPEESDPDWPDTPTDPSLRMPD